MNLSIKAEGTDVTAVHSEQLFISAAPIPAGSGEIDETGAVRLPAKAWEYGAFWRLNESGEGPAVISLEVQVEGGDIGLLCVDETLSNPVAPEIFVQPGAGQTPRVLVPAMEKAAALVIRKGPSIAQPTTVRVDVPRIELDVEDDTRANSSGNGHHNSEAPFQSPYPLAAKFWKPSLNDTQTNFLSAAPFAGHAFAVVSWGCAATHWLAWALNAHPDIFCEHHVNPLMTGLDIISRPLDGLEYLRLLLIDKHSYKAVGDVHGIARHEINALRETLGDDFGCAILVREPLARVRSQLARFSYQGGANNSDYVDSLAAAADLDPQALTTKQLDRLHGINMLNAIIEEEATGARIFRMEDITRDPSAFTDLVTEITKGKIACDSSWVETVLNRPRPNVHGPTPVELDDWTMTMLGRVVKKEAWAIYAKLGYPVPEAVV
ncbi:hypothetical protein [Brucella sp. IR073]|uniref:hypothetical protein n=1 Tax=unclassified Brucella TaxID=2632610 RepID=UPI003B98360C